MQRRLRILDHQHTGGAEGDDAVADFRADRAAAAGDNDRLAAHELLQPPVIDLDARAQQQILDIDRREPQRLAAFVKRREPAGRKSEAPRLHQDCFRLQCRVERRGREHDARDRSPALGGLGHRLFEIIEPADDGDAAHRLTLIGE